MIGEIKAKGLNSKRFIEEKVKEIQEAVGEGLAINALSGGVDSSTVTMLGHRALGRRLKTVFIENGLMREGEPRRVVGLFKKLRVPVEIVDAREEFFAALKGVTDPEAKREAITQTFYKHVFGRVVKQSGARFLLQGIVQLGEGVAQLHACHESLEPFHHARVAGDVLCQRGDIPRVIIQEGRLDERGFHEFLQQLPDQFTACFARFELQPLALHHFTKRLGSRVLADVDS